MIFTYKIADVVFNGEIRYKQTVEYMKDYLAQDDEKAEFTVTVTDEDLKLEKKLTPNPVPEYFYEYTALYRKFIYVLMEKYDAFFFHCSAISVDNEAYMFTAQSGTGKSTHRNLWMKAFGDRVTVINDDKPIIRRIDGEFYVYGTPWRGKESMGNNIRAKAKALCFLSRSEENYIGKIDTVTAFSRSLNQTIRPEDPKLMSNLLELLDGFFTQVKCFDLRVNMEEDAAVVAYKGINGN